MTNESSKKCLSCGISLQNNDSFDLGFVNNVDKHNVCQRCFRLENYQIFDEKIFLEKVVNPSKNVEGNLFLVIDLFNVNYALFDFFRRNWSKKITLIINKTDLFPFKLNEQLIRKYLKQYTNLKFEKIFFVSSKRNFNIAQLYHWIVSNQKRNNYFCGYENSGKTSLIKALLNFEGSSKHKGLISSLQGTTQEPIVNKLNNKQNLIDFPGKASKDSFFNLLSFEDYKKIDHNKKLKSQTNQIKENRILFIDGFAYLEIETETPFSCISFFHPSLKIHSAKIDNLQKLIDSKNFFQFNFLNDLTNSYLIERTINSSKQMILFPSLGIVIFEPVNQKINIRYPKQVKLQIRESFY